MRTAYLKKVCTFSGKDRDSRGWSIGVLYFALLPRDQVHAALKHKVDVVQWVDVQEHGLTMAFDHEAQLNKAVSVLQRKVARHALPLHLMPAQFTLTALQKTCEAILGCALDESAFRRRIHPDPARFPGHVPELVKVEAAKEGGRQRPAQIYRASERGGSNSWSRDKGASELKWPRWHKSRSWKTASGSPNALLPSGRWSAGAKRAA